MVYCPAGTETLYEPSEPVVVEFTTVPSPVSMRTVAFATGVPSSSVTCPAADPISGGRASETFLTLLRVTRTCCETVR
jgi:hypothetical protein